MRARRTIGATAATALLLGGCWGGDDDTGGGPQARELPEIQLAASLRRFGSCDEIRGWVRDELAPRVGAYGFPGLYYGGGDEFRTMAVEDSAAAAPQAEGDAGTAPTETAAPNFSETNVQEQGVDEPDIVKTDGTRIVTVANGSLHLISPESQRVLDSVSLPGGMYDGQILLAGDRVLVFGSDTFDPMPLAESDASRISMPGLPGTRVAQFDIDGEELKLADAFVLDGTFVSARMVGDVVRLVVHADPEQRLGFVAPAVPTEAAIERAKQSNRDVVDAATGEDFLPQWRQVDENGGVTNEGALLGCEDAHAPNTFAGFGMVAVVSIDLSDGLQAGIESRRGTGVMAGGQTVYASADHLYVAAPEWQDWETLSEADLRIASENHGTDIHRFDITDPTQADYEMSGRVDGDLLNQFAMDEHDGNLRIATTTGSQWAADGDQSQSQVVVLAPEDGALTEVGKVTGLGQGETIQSVRFLDDVAYVVTFRQTDPLYTVDLSDPANPRVVGELKILGYSAYLHPIGDGRLIGIGQDATDEGARLGTQVALFDVSDPAAPTRVAQAVLPNASSDAEWDHHAFLWWAETGLVAIPVNSYTETETFQGLIGYHVDLDAASISELGRIAHGAAPVGVIEEPSPPETTVPTPPADVTKPADDAVTESIIVDPGGVIAPDFVAPITRSFVIGDKLWTLSQSSLGVSDLATLGQTSIIPLA